MSKNIEIIVNYKKHPLSDYKYQLKCKNILKKKSVLILKKFLNRDALIQIQNEALSLQNKAFYCKQNHTILLNKKDKKKDINDPLNIEVISDKGCVPHDLILQNSHLNTLYKSVDFKKFLIKVLNVENIYPYKDKLSSINYNYYQFKQQLGWHFDNASFAITLLIQSPEKGGIFEYINEGRDYKNNYINKRFIEEVLKNKVKTKNIKANEGTLILFFGRNYLHRVTKVESLKPRILVTLNYNEEKNIALSSNARKTFFGRLN